jgi:putative tricarboxylic transport membrane protein
LIISRGDMMTFIERPISAGLLLVAVGLLTIALLPTIRKSREEVFVE